MQYPPIKDIGEQFIKMVMYIRQAPDFIQENKLWNGYFKHKWVATLTIIIAIIISYTFFTEVTKLFTSAPATQNVAQNAMAFFSGIGAITSNMFLSGGLKYLILIILEVFIFHITVKTYEILSGEEQELTFKMFVDAEVRMIKVAIRCLIYEFILSLIAGIILGILGLGAIKIIVIFLIQAYFFGLAFIDNYNEAFKIKIKESFGIAFQNLGATVLIGVVGYILIFIPLIGVILAPFICAVSTTLYMYYSVNRQVIPVI